MAHQALSRRLVLGMAAGAASVVFAPNASAIPALSLKGKDGSFERVTSAKTLTFGTSNDQPFSFLDPKTGQLAGVDAEMLLAMLSKLGIPDHKVMQVDFNGLIPGLLASRMDLIADAMYITEKRKKVINFSDGWYQYGETLLVKKGNPMNLHTLADLGQGAKVGSQLGTVYLDWLNAIPGAKVSSYPEAATMMEDLKTGRLDAGLIDAPVAGFALSKNPDYIIAFEMVSDYQPKEIGVIGSGFRKEDAALLEAFNWALAAIKADETDLAILKRWGLGEQNRYLAS